MSPSKLITTAALLGCLVDARAQSLPYPPPQNVLQLAATGTVEVQQDLLSLSLTATREGADPVAVQEQLKAALDAALTVARAAAQPRLLEVRTGQFGLAPRYTQDGKISSWQGTTELVLQGRDFPRITQTAARIETLTVARVGYDLSREERARVEREAQSAAIGQFKAKAADLARDFGFSGYSLREVAVNANDHGIAPRYGALSAAAAAPKAMPLPVEAGKTAVAVTVSGSVQLR
ncbi:SIMPL domain-containing protein [Ramlibacter sp.]|uniref:SIMPL domain-containing protein n=1 Tax=Ramlibacter sp. TaxID=1917967 RepID=UPI002B8F4713|nr:SIMPL domain-containing protein [Ramlibacter sp.]HWI81544.1 SIMPL domain-containing protein [Ramlibacter sp.]